MSGQAFTGWPLSFHSREEYYRSTDKYSLLRYQCYSGFGDLSEEPITIYQWCAVSASLLTSRALDL